MDISAIGGQLIATSWAIFSCVCAETATFLLPVRNLLLSSFSPTWQHRFPITELKWNFGNIATFWAIFAVFSLRLRRNGYLCTSYQNLPHWLQRSQFPIIEGYRGIISAIGCYLPRFCNFWAVCPCTCAETATFLLPVRNLLSQSFSVGLIFHWNFGNKHCSWNIREYQLKNVGKVLWKKEIKVKYVNYYPRRLYRSACMGRIFESVCLFVCLFACLSVCLQHNSKMNNK